MYREHNLRWEPLQRGHARVKIVVHEWPVHASKSGSARHGGVSVVAAGKAPTAWFAHVAP